LHRCFQIQGLRDYLLCLYRKDCEVPFLPNVPENIEDIAWYAEVIELYTVSSNILQRSTRFSTFKHKFQKMYDKT